VSKRLLVSRIDVRIRAGLKADFFALLRPEQLWVAPAHESSSPETACAAIDGRHGCQDAVRALIRSVAWRPGVVVWPLCRAHGFASPPYDGFAVSKCRRRLVFQLPRNQNSRSDVHRLYQRKRCFSKHPSQVRRCRFVPCGKKPPREPAHG